MFAFVVAVAACVPVVDPDGSYPLPDGASVRAGRPSQNAGPKLIAAAFSADGKKLATMTQTDVTVRCAVTGRQLYGRELLQLHGSGSADGLAFSPCGRWLAVIDFVTVRVIDLATGAEVELRPVEKLNGRFDALYVRFVSCGVVRVLGRERVVKKGESDGPWEAVDFDPDTGARLSRRTLPGQPVSVSRDGRVLILYDGDSFRRFDAIVWRYAGEPIPQPARIFCEMVIDATGRRIAYLEENELRVFDTRTGQRRLTAKIPKPLSDSNQTRPILSPDGNEAAVASRLVAADEWQLPRWNVDTGKELSALTDTRWYRPGAIYGPGAGTVTVFGLNGFFAPFDRATGKRIGAETRPMQFGVSGNGKWLASYGGNEAVARDAETGRLMSRFRPKRAPDFRFAVNDDGTDLIDTSHRAGQPIPGTRKTVAVDGGRLLLREIEDGGAVVVVPFPPNHRSERGPRLQLVVSADGKRIAVSTETYVDLFDSDGKHLRRFQVIPIRDDAMRMIHSDWVRSVHGIALSADGAWLALGHVSYINTGGFPPRGSVEIYETATGGFVTKIEPRLGTPTPLAFAPSVRHLWTEENHEALRWSLRPPPMPTFNRANLLPDLSSDDARTAYLAAGRLAAPGMLKYLGEQLPLDKLPDAKRVAEWVKQLGDRDFQVREAATLALVAMGPGVASALRAEVKAPASAESGRRAALVLNRVGRDDAPGVLLRRRAVTAVMMLVDERPDARKLLVAWAAGDPGLPLTDAARAAVRN